MGVSDEKSRYELDDIDRGVLFALQRDARNVTAQEVAEAVNVSASTVRNRISKMEEAGVIRGYLPVIDYERAGFPIRVMFVATAANDDRSRLAETVVEAAGVVDVREMMTGRCNLLIEVVARNTRELNAITDRLNELDVELVDADIVVGQHTRPFGEFVH